MSARLQTWLWIAQRGSAAVLALAVSVHLVTIVLAVRGGLSAAEIIGRLQGSGAWLGFYLLFVLAAAIHAPIGVRTILMEALPRSPRIADALSGVLMALILVMGCRSVLGLYAAPIS